MESDYIDNIAIDVYNWSNKVLPNRKPINALTKLVLEEIPELLTNLKDRGKIDPGELADCFILLLDVAILSNIMPSQAIKDKMIVNKFRKWEVDETTGLLVHTNENT